MAYRAKNCYGGRNTLGQVTAEKPYFGAIVHPFLNHIKYSYLFVSIGDESYLFVSIGDEFICVRLYRR